MKISRKKYLGVSHGRRDATRRSIRASQALLLTRPPA